MPDDARTPLLPSLTPAAAPSTQQPRENKTWQVLDDVAARARRYLEGVGERRVSPGADALAGIEAFDVPLQDAPRSAAAVVEEFDRVGEPATVAISGPRYFGFVNGGSLPAAVAVNWLATAWDQHGAFRVSGAPSSALLIPQACDRPSENPHYRSR